MSEDLIVTVQDLRASRICLQGARPWFRRHGLDWQAFLAHGLRPGCWLRPATRWRFA
jgi:hypothetical protein